MYVLLLSGHELPIMPVNVPILPKVDIHHLLLINILYLDLFPFILDILAKFKDWRIIHHGSCVDCDILSVLKICARLSSALE